MKREYPIKVCFVGDPAVGKTSIISKFMHGEFTEEYLVTMGVCMSSKRIEYDDINLIFTTFDLAGQKEFLLTNKLFFEGAASVVFVYDITRRETLYHIPDWHEIYKKSKSYDKESTSTILVGCKIDLESKRQVEINEARELAKELEIEHVMEVSAKTGYNVSNLFDIIAHEFAKRRLKLIRKGKVK